MLHDGKSRRVAIVGGVRIPFCRAHSIYTGCSNQDMMTATLEGLVAKYDLKGQVLGDVALGAVIKHSKDWNLARESVIGSGLSLRTPGVDLQRACGTSIEACIQIGRKRAVHTLRMVSVPGQPFVPGLVRRADGKLRRKLGRYVKTPITSAA